MLAGTLPFLRTTLNFRFLVPFGLMQHRDGAQGFVHAQKALPTKVHLTAFQRVSELPTPLLSQVTPPLMPGPAYTAASHCYPAANTTHPVRCSCSPRN